MKRLFKSILGVTLLEIMLVLAIAALIIVMSVKYYQGATSSNKINTTIEVVQASVTGAEQYLSATGAATSTITSAAMIQSYFPNNTVPNSPYGGGTIALTGVTGSKYTIVVTGVNTSDCPQLTAMLSASNPKFSPSCTGGSLNVLVSE